jgi:transcriptional regulator with XRE-family HTH domain
VATLQEALAKFVSGRMAELGLSTYEVARNSGGAITHQTVWSVANAQGADVKLSTIEALARGLRVPAEELFHAARGRVASREESPDEIRAATFFKGLPPERQQDALMVLEALHREHGVKPADVKSLKKHKRKVA